MRTDQRAIDRLLAGRAPAATLRTTWSAELVLDVGAYPEPVELPGSAVSSVTSVRCLVWIGERVLVCQSPDGPHIWPGGRREVGETFAVTARREVHEETGWWLGERLRPLGFLHYRFAVPPPPDFPYPATDFLQAVYAGVGVDRDGGVDGDWTDTEGVEWGSLPHPLSEVDEMGLPEIQRVFLRVTP